MNQKFIAYFHLVEACAEPGCPVCRCVVDAARRELEALIWEQVNDPETRRDLQASWGFCNWHTWTLEEIPNARFGAAIIHEDLLRLAVHRVRSLRQDGAVTTRFRSWIGRLSRPGRGPAILDLYRRRPPCRVCKETEATERHLLETILSFVGDPQLRRAYERSDGLCVPHALRTAEIGRSGAAADEVLSLTLPKWGALRQSLDRFLSKHDYRTQEPVTDEEATACRRAFATLAGAPGLFGHSLRLQAWPAPSPTPAPATEPPKPAEWEEFERRKLDLRVRELTEQLNEASSRAAALHYRLSRVMEDRNALEMNLTGERGAYQLAERALADLRAENERLRSELAQLRVKSPEANR